MLWCTQARIFFDGLPRSSRISQLSRRRDCENASHLIFDRISFGKTFIKFLAWKPLCWPPALKSDVIVRRNYATVTFPAAFPVVYPAIWFRVIKRDACCGYRSRGQWPSHSPCTVHVGEMLSQQKLSQLVKWWMENQTEMPFDRFPRTRWRVPWIGIRHRC